MNDKQLMTLLQQADESAGLPALPSDLPGRIRWKARRRNQIMTATRITTLAAMLLIAVGISLWLKADPPAVPADTDMNISSSSSTGSNGSPAELIPAPSPETLTKTDLVSRLALVEETMARLKQNAQLAQLQQKLTALPDAVEEVDLQLERAAFTTVYYADRKLNELNLKESAVADYKQVITLYPHTLWAQKAGEILAQLESDRKGDLL
ncbi:MAG: hypothetical protein JW860_02465 [Sedimentisphaerales bacterium]|nr:hypothetical protein [Sedimentisphaerales bacterium]